MTDLRFGSATPSPEADAWERISTLFETVMSLPPDARVTFLETSCAGDAPMRAELLTLISGADDAPQFLRALASDVVGPSFAAATVDDVSHTPTPIPLTGRRIRHFEVRAPLGAGGMGAVYLGRDTMLDRDVALKFLPSEQFADPAARRRLVREAQAASALNDPNVCAMYAIEETDDGGLCLVMSYCSGGTLRDRLRAGPLSVADAIDVATQLASGLASAHRQNIVHRDLKPANIGFANDGGTPSAATPSAATSTAATSISADSISATSTAPGANGAVLARANPIRAIAKILDFGVAVRAGSDDAASGGTASIAGTLPYMAPEVLRGGSADARADVWALGVILHEMLVGQRPFAAAGDATLLYAILEDAPRPLVRSDGVLIPPTVAALVTDMLAKNTHNRPADGAEVLAQLRALGESHNGTPASTTVTSGTRVHHSRGSTSKSLFIAGISLAVSAALVLSVVWNNSRKGTATAPIEVARIDSPLPPIAVLPFTVRGGPELQYLHEGMVDLLTPAFDATGLLHGVDPNSSIGAARALGAVPLDSANAQTLAVRLGARRYVVGSVVRAGEGFTLLATLYHAEGNDVARAQVNVANADQLSSGVESLVRQLIAAELRAPGDTVAGLAATMTTSNRALRAYLDGERELRDARPAAAVAYFTRATEEDSLFALAWYRLARAARWSEVDSLNARAVRRAFDLSASLPLRLQQLVRGYYALRVGSPVEAERQFRQIVSDYPTDVDAWMLLGETLFDNNQYQGRPTNDAVSAFRRVMALDMRNREVTVYLMELAARANRRGELDTLFQMYFSPNSAGEQPGIRETYLALHARREGLNERTIDDPVSAQIALRRVGSEPSDIRAAQRFASVLARSSNRSAMRVEGLLALATIEFCDGQSVAAGGHWRDAALLDENATLLHRALMLVAPTAAVSPDTLRAVRRRLDTPPIPAAAPGELSSEEQRSLRVYLSGLLSSQLQDTAALLRAQAQLARVRTADRLAGPLGAALRGHLALARGNNAEAIAAFESSVVSIPFEVRSRIPALGQQVDRFARAEALLALSRPADAKRWYLSILDGPALWSVPYRGIVAERLRAIP
ncbi:MAG: serine/threonine-protein kinase [Gemmatimonas sp.]